jgi:hypothetical protein
VKYVLAGIGASAILMATAITTCQPSRGPHAGADNHCPAGCIKTPTVIVPDIIVQDTRAPWIVGKPHGSGVQQTPSTTLYSTANRPAPGRKPAPP